MAGGVEAISQQIVNVKSVPQFLFFHGDNVIIIIITIIIIIMIIIIIIIIIIIKNL